jgi:hypothetical protein
MSVAIRSKRTTLSAFARVRISSPPQSSLKSLGASLAHQSHALTGTPSQAYATGDTRLSSDEARDLIAAAERRSSAG